MSSLRFPFLAMFAFILFSFVHEYYVSVTQIEYLEEKQTLQLITRIDFEDLEYTLQERYDKSIDLTTLNEKENVKDFIVKYLDTKLKVRVNGELVDFNFIGKEYDNDQVVCYLEAENIDNPDFISVENSVLFDNFPKQRNVIRLNIYSETSNLLCIKEDDTKRLYLK